MRPALTRTPGGAPGVGRPHPDPADRPQVATSRALGLILATGESSRLSPLTLHRPKPAVRFGTQHRLIDFPLSNLVNGGIRDIALLTQQTSFVLEQHISTVWSDIRTRVDRLQCLSPRFPSSDGRYIGSANALYQNLDFIVDRGPEHVVVVASDHIYRIDPAKMLDAHVSSGAGVTIAAVPVPASEASQYGIVAADSNGRVRHFTEKPAHHQPPMPDHSGRVLASMGSYVFDAEMLADALKLDAVDASNRHDIGAHIIPRLVAAGEAFVYDFTADLLAGQQNHERGYWRDVGTLDAYYQASMDLLAPDPLFSLDNLLWPIRGDVSATDRARVPSSSAEGAAAENSSIVSPTADVAGARIYHSVVSPHVRIHPGAVVTDSVLLDGVVIGRDATIKGAVIDEHVIVPHRATVGAGATAHSATTSVTRRGIVVVGRKAWTPNTCDDTIGMYYLG